MMKTSKILKISTAVMYALGLGVAAINVEAKESVPSTSPASAEAEVKLESLFQQAKQAAQQGDADRAIALLTQMLERDPEHLQA